MANWGHITLLIAGAHLLWIHHLPLFFVGAPAGKNLIHGHHQHSWSRSLQGKSPVKGGMSRGWMGRQSWNSGITHMIHVWYIYLHLPWKSTKCRQIYHTWILWVMVNVAKNTPFQPFWKCGMCFLSESHETIRVFVGKVPRDHPLESG